MLTAITAPTTRNLMAPAATLSRLKLPESELADIEIQVAEASGLVSRYLGFEPAYGVWEETFRSTPSAYLDLGARPAWSITSVTDRAGTILNADVYRLIRGPYGESSVSTPLGGFGLWDLERPGSFSLINVPVLSPDWTVRYIAGWWLEEMAGAVPVGVEAFPVELQADFLSILRWRRATASHIPGIKRMKDEGAEVEFFGSPEAVDPRTGIPAACTLSLQYYRRP